jgi:hypothetical protein
MIDGLLLQNVKCADRSLNLVCAIGGGDSKDDDENVPALSDGRNDDADDDDDDGVSNPCAADAADAADAVNSFQAIAPLTAHEKGVHFLGEHISLKSDPKDFY